MTAAVYIHTKYAAAWATVVCRQAAECCLRWQCFKDTALIAGASVAAVVLPGSLRRRGPLLMKHLIE
jgi:hypothetical protein